MCFLWCLWGELPLLWANNMMGWNARRLHHPHMNYNWLYEVWPWRDEHNEAVLDTLFMVVKAFKTPSLVLINRFRNPLYHWLPPSFSLPVMSGGLRLCGQRSRDHQEEVSEQFYYFITVAVYFDFILSVACGYWHLASCVHALVFLTEKVFKEISHRAPSVCENILLTKYWKCV